MAKKKTEEQKKEDPKYMKICESSNSCTAERSARTLNDMQVVSCRQCFHVLSWEKISVDKKSDAPKSKVKKSEPIEEAKVVEAVAEPVVEAKVESKTDQDAAKLRDTFQGLDDIMSNVENNIAVAPVEEAPVPKAQPVIDDFDPFENEVAVDVEVQVKVGFFKVDAMSRKAKEMIRLILVNESGTNKFIFDKETPEKNADFLEKSPDKIIGNYVKAEYKGLDEKGNPKEFKYLLISKKAE